MSRIVRVASVSFPGVQGKGEERWDRAVGELLEWVDRAALDRPDIVLVPELAPYLGTSIEEMVQFAQPVPGPLTEAFGQRARRYGCYLWCPLVEQAPEGLYNSAVLLDRDGGIVGVYRKAYPTISEMEQGILPGEGPVVLEVDFGKVGCLICFDLNFRELGRAYRERGAELMCFLSMFRGGLQLSIWAYEFRAFMASATPGENSRIVDPLGRVLADSSQYGRLIWRDLNLDFAVLHIDYNHEKFPDIKKKYGPEVAFEVTSPEGVFLMSSQGPRSVWEVIEEFGLETLDAYLDRARRERKVRLDAVRKGRRPGGKEGLCPR